jgi:hypothetical protein
LLNYKNILEELIGKITKSEGVLDFATREKQAKFENWLQVELCGVLRKNHTVTPEKYVNYIREGKQSGNSYDIFLDSTVAIELKIFTNNGKSGSENVKRVIKDISKLKDLPGNIVKLEILLVYFITNEEDERRWNEYRTKIETGMKSKIECLIKSGDFNFKGSKEKGRLYLYNLA